MRVHVNGSDLLNFARIVIDDQHRVSCDVQMIGDASQAFRFRLPSNAAGRKVLGPKKEIRSPQAELGKIALVILGEDC
jgi:hypothetical protein